MCVCVRACVHVLHVNTSPAYTGVYHVSHLCAQLAWGCTVPVCVCVCVCLTHFSPRYYVKQLELVCLPGHAREDSSRGKSVAALCVEGLVMVVGLSCHLGESWRQAMLLGLATSSEVGSGQEVDAVALHLVRKFQVCWRVGCIEVCTYVRCEGCEWV